MKIRNIIKNIRIEIKLIFAKSKKTIDEGENYRLTTEFKIVEGVVYITKTIFTQNIPYTNWSKETIINR